MPLVTVRVQPAQRTREPVQRVHVERARGWIAQLRHARRPCHQPHVRRIVAVRVRHAAVHTDRGRVLRGVEPSVRHADRAGLRARARHPNRRHVWPRRWVVPTLSHKTRAVARPAHHAACHRGRPHGGSAQPAFPRTGINDLDDACKRRKPLVGEQQPVTRLDEVRLFDVRFQQQVEIQPVASGFLQITAVALWQEGEGSPLVPEGRFAQHAQPHVSR